MTRLSDLGPPIPARPHGAKADGYHHFYECATCGQKVDMRDTRQMMWHERPEHEPLEREPEAAIIKFPFRKSPAVHS
jgi:hypothetical protein